MRVATVVAGAHPEPARERTDVYTGSARGSVRAVWPAVSAVRGGRLPKLAARLGARSPRPVLPGGRAPLSARPAPRWRAGTETRGGSAAEPEGFELGAGHPLESSSQGVAAVGGDELVELPAGAVGLAFGEHEQIPDVRGEVHGESPLWQWHAESFNCSVRGIDQRGREL